MSILIEGETEIKSFVDVLMDYNYSVDQSRQIYFMLNSFIPHLFDLNLKIMAEAYQVWRLTEYNNEPANIINMIENTKGYKELLFFTENQEDTTSIKSIKREENINNYKLFMIRYYSLLSKYINRLSAEVLEKITYQYNYNWINIEIYIDLIINGKLNGSVEDIINYIKMNVYTN